MMRVVVDTNVLVRAIIKPNGSVGPVIRRLRDGDFTFLFSSATLEELADVLARSRIREKYGITVEDVKTVIQLCLLRGERAEPDRPVVACRDPKDNRFLEVAIASRADIIVSGDLDLLILSPFEGIPIVSPAVFLARLGASQEE